MVALSILETLGMYGLPWPATAVSNSSFYILVFAEPIPPVQWSGRDKGERRKWNGFGGERNIESGAIAANQ